jgi:hypothetical protein
MAVTSRRPDEKGEPRSRCVDVRISWGDVALLVAELAPPRPLFVGADDAWEDGETPSACALPEAVIGGRRAALVDVDGDGAVSVFVPPGASAELFEDGRAPRTRVELVGDGLGRRCDAISGAVRVRLPPAARLRVESGAFVFEVGDGDACSKTPRARFGWRGAIWTVVSAVFHLALLLVCARYLPPLDARVDDQAIEADQVLGSFQGFVALTAEPDLEMPDAPTLGDTARRGSNLAREDGGTRPMGAPPAPHASLRYGVAGPADNADPHIARHAADGEPRFTFIPGDSPPSGGDAHAPLAPWGRDDSLGNDPESARGEMWGTEIDESFGAAGLGLAGDAECGCGSARALARGEVRDLLLLVRHLDPPRLEGSSAIVERAAATRATHRSR